jgi:hypothetical protein
MEADFPGDLRAARDRYAAQLSTMGEGGSEEEQVVGGVSITKSQ